MDFFSDLNSQQMDAVVNGEGPCLVLAGAGSGKTRTITYRVAYLLDQGVKPEEILLLTFTNKAAAEMKKRIKDLTGMEKDLPMSGTFHHVAYKILKKYNHVSGYESGFTIVDSDDSLSLIKIAVKEIKPKSGAIKFPSANILRSLISLSRNSEKELEKIISDKYEHFEGLTEEIKEVARLYHEKKKESNVMDFDDLLSNLVLFLNSPAAVPFIKNFRYILVDEYQDTNKIQHSIIKSFCVNHQNIFAVGDDAQSIYSFRGAEVKNILRFEKDFPNAKIFKLETNYRSSQEILDVANESIAGNADQYEKKLRALKNGPRPLLNSLYDQKDEARYIVRVIRKHLEQGVPYGEIAVLFRASFHSQQLEMELVKSGIKYEYRGGLRFFERAHVKDVLSYLRVLSNPLDGASWLRILLRMEGIGMVGAQKIIKAIREIFVARPKTPDDLGGFSDLKNLIEQKIIPTKAKNDWQSLCDLLERMAEVGEKNVAGLVEKILSSDYILYLESEYTDAKDRLEDLKQIAVFARDSRNLDDFLAEAGLQESFLGPENENSGQEQRIILSTVHQAKGLEWETVFVLNLSDGAFPSDKAWKETNGIEEERRLFYVAVTRAKQHLYLTYPSQRGSGWQTSSNGPSMFLQEIKQDLIEGAEDIFGDDDDLSFTVDEPEEIEYVDEMAEYEDGFKQKRGGFLIDV